MKIAIISPFQFRIARGIERFVWSLTEALVSQNAQVSIFTWHWHNPVSWGVLPSGVSIRYLPDTRYFREKIAPLFYLGWLAQDHYDWVLSFFGTYGEVTTLRWLPQRTRSCIVFHFPRELVTNQYTAFRRYHTAQRAAKLVAVNKYVAQGVEETYERPCVTIGNGVNPDLFRVDPLTRVTVRQELHLQPTAPLLITMAALEERKGIQWVIRALPFLLHDFPDLQYLVLGEGSFRVSLDSEIQQLGLSNVVHLPGSTEDVVKYLNAADIGLLLSSGEAFGLSLIEYMAMELPVVTSSHPPFDELVKEDWGYTVNEQDPQAVADQIRKLLQDPDKRQQLGKAGRQQVLDHYTWSQVATEYLRLFADQTL